MDHILLLGVLSIVMGLISCSLIAKWYVIPYLFSIPREKAFQPLLLMHTFRYVGLAFIVPGVVSPELSTTFANQAAFGDLAAAFLAFLALAALRLRWSSALMLVWIFNVVGTLDFLIANLQGMRLIEPGHLGASYYIPVLAVPPLFVAHYIIFKLLLQKK